MSVASLLPRFQDENKAYQMQLQFLEHVPLMKRLPKDWGWEPGVDLGVCLLFLVGVAPFKPVVTPPSSSFVKLSEFLGPAIEISHLIK